MPGCAVRTTAPDGTGRRYLGTLGNISGLRFSFTIPGGCDQMSAALMCDPRLRTDALNPGRYVEVLAGGEVAWDGTLLEPSPQDGGWAIQAAGSGTSGSNFFPSFTTWAADAPDTVIGNAITDGLNWLPSSIGHPAGMFLGQAPDNAAMSVTDMLNQVCSLGGMTWHVRRTPGGNLPEVITLPVSTPTHLLVSTTPAPRTWGDGANWLKIRYQSAPDLGHGYPAVYSTTFVKDQQSIDTFGPVQDFIDLSSNGTMPAADAQAVGTAIFNHYKRASFAGPFTVLPGQLLSAGGAPADLRFPHYAGPMVCKLLLADQPYGGEITPGAPVFLAGAYEYDEDTGSATVTPYQSIDSDFSQLASLRAGEARGRRVTISRGQTRILWWFGKYAKSWQDIHVVKTPRHRRYRGPGGSGGGGPR